MHLNVSVCASVGKWAVKSWWYKKRHLCTFRMIKYPLNAFGKKTAIKKALESSNGHRMVRFIFNKLSRTPSFEEYTLHFNKNCGMKVVYSDLSMVRSGGERCQTTKCKLIFKMNWFIWRDKVHAATVCATGARNVHVNHFSCNIIIFQFKMHSAAIVVVIVAFLSHRFEFISVKHDCR